MVSKVDSTGWGCLNYFDKVVSQQAAGACIPPLHPGGVVLTDPDPDRFDNSMIELQSLSKAARRTVTKLRILSSQDIPAIRIHDAAQADRRRLQILCGTACILLLLLILASAKALNSSQHFKIGVSALESGRPIEAIDQLTTCLAANQSLAIAYQYRAMAYAQNGDHARAVADFTRLLSMQPRNSDAYMGRACQYSQMHAYKEAADDFSHALKLEPDLSEAYRLRAAANMKLGEFPLVVQDCRLYLDHGSRQKSIDRQVNVLLLLSSALKELGKMPDAVAACSQAIALDGANSQLYEQRALLFKDQRRFREAIADCTAAIKSGPTADRFKLRASCYQAQGESSRALDDLDQAVQLSPHRLDLRRDRASLAVAAHDYRRALADLNVVLDAEPENREVAGQIEQASKLAAGAAGAGVAVASGQRLQSAGDTARGIIGNPDAADPASLIVKGYQLIRSGDATRAVVILRAAVRAQPQNVSARRYLAYALLACGKGVDAADQFELISGMHGLLPEDLLSFARALEQAGYIHKALGRYEDYVFLRPDDVSARLALVNAYERDGQPAKAWETAREGMRRCKDPADIERYREVMPEDGNKDFRSPRNRQ